MTLFRPLLHIIFKYVRIIDLFNLDKLGISSHYQDNKTIIKKHIIYNIHKRLKYLLGNKYEKFMYYMKKSNASLSGSFVLQCILNEYWDDSDIDIYLVYKKYDKCYMCYEQEEEHKFLSHCFFNMPFGGAGGAGGSGCQLNLDDYLQNTSLIDKYGYDVRQFLYNNNKLYCNCVINKKCKCSCHTGYLYYTTLCKYSYIDNFLYTHFGDQSRNFDNFDNDDDKYPLQEIGLVQVASFLDQNHKKIQIIKVQDDIFKFVNNFDLNMLKNIYYFDENGNENIYIFNIDDIKNRKITINRDIDHIHKILKKRLETRIKKYQTRGFSYED